MDKQAWIAVTLCLAGLVGWQYYFSSKYPTVPPTAPTAAVAGVTPGASAAPASANEAAPAVADRPAVSAEHAPVAAAAAPAAAPAPAEQTLLITTPQIELHFTSLGGGIATAVPLGKEHLVEGGKDIELNQAGHIPIGALSLQPDEDATEPYALRQEGDKVIAERDRPDGLRITKEYTLDWQGNRKQFPAVHLKITYTNSGAQPYKNSGFYISAGSASPIHRRDQRELPYLAYDWLSDGKYHTDHSSSFDAGHIPLIGETHPGRTVITTPVSKAAWVAVKNQFYTTIVTPLDAPVDQEPAARQVWARRIDLPLTAQEIADNSPPLHGLDVALGLPPLELAPGETKTQDFQIYAGPKFYSRLETLGHDEQEVMDFGKFKVVSIALLGLMNIFRSWFGSYAIAIILLTILVKGLLFPLQNKANKSMKRMQVLNPELTALREKYKDDPTKQQQETMKLYKAHGMSPLAPLGGCWPMLIQMPIFFGFLYMLYTAAELRNSSFLWVHDLSQPDTVARLPLPGYGTIPINVLPLLMISAQFWQMTLTPKTGDPSQQKTMMFMPLLFGFFCYNFAAALALYYTMQTLLTILQLYLTRTQSTAPPLAEAVRVSGDPGPGTARGGGGVKKGPGSRFSQR